jgi:uncharacterized Zn finger protein
MSWDWSFRSYVSAAEKRRRAKKETDALEKKGQKLNPIRVDGRTIARSFWGKAWCKNLESYSDYENRLPRGRSYVRNGSVVDFRIGPGVIKALVSGSDLYRITIKIQPVQQAEWKALKTECAGRVGSLIDLLQGKLSAPVMEIITRRETGLFPRPAEIRLDCSCPDWAGMCKHVAATLYAVGVRLDESPELLFELRGTDHLELVTEATTSVTNGASAFGDGPPTLIGENLEEIFGIEIENAAPRVAGASVSKLPKSPTTQPPSPDRSRSRGSTAVGARNLKAPPANTTPRGGNRAKHPQKPKSSAKHRNKKGTLS